MIREWPSIRFWRRLGIGVGAGLLIFLLVVRLFAMTPLARGLVESRLEALSLRGQSVELEGLRGDLLGRIKIDALTVEDADGVWAEARDLSVDWSPLRLVFGHLKIDEVDVSTLSLRRRPGLAPAAAPSQNRSSAISRYDVQSIGVEEVLFGTAPGPAYRLAGALNARQTSGALRLDFRPHSGTGDVIDGRLQWGGETPLSGDLRVEGAPSGLIATLLKVPDGDAVAASLAASGSRETWQLTAHGQVGSETVLEARVAQSAGEIIVQSQANLFPFGGLQSLRERLGDQLAVDARLDPTGELVASAQADVLTLTASSQVIQVDPGLSIERLKVEASGIDAGRLAQHSTLELPRLSLEGQLVREEDWLSFEGDVTIPVVSFAGYRATDLQNTGRVRASADRIEVNLGLSALALEGLPASIQPVLSGLLSGQLIGSVELNTQSVEVAQLAIEGDDVQVTGRGTFGHSSTIDLSGTLALNQLPAMDSVAGDWTIQGADSSTVGLTFDGVSRMDESVSALGEIVGPEATLALRLQRESTGWVFDEVLAASARARITAAGSFKDQVLELRGNARAANLSYSQVEASDLDLSVNLSGPLNGLVAAADGAATRVAYAGEELRSATLTGTVALAQDFDTQLSLSGIVREQPLNVTALARYSDFNLTIEDTTLSWAGLVGDGTGVIDLGDMAQSRLGLGIAGTSPLTGVVTASFDYAEQTLSASAELGARKMGQFELDRGLASMSGSWPNFAGAVSYQGQVDGLDSSIPVSGEHDFVVNAAQMAVGLEGTLRLADQDIDIAAPQLVTFEPQPVVRAEIAAFGGRGDVVLDPSGQTRSQLNLQDVALSGIASILQRPDLRGRLSGAATVELLDNGLNGAARFELTDLAVADPTAAPADLTLTADLVADQLTSRLVATGRDEALDVVAALAAQLSHENTLFSARLKPNTPVPIELSGSGQIAPLVAFVLPSNLRLEGQVTLDLSNGTGETFRFTGPVQIENGAFEDGLTGLHLRDIEVNADLATDGVTIAAARAQGGRSGRVDARGHYGFDGASDVTLELTGLNAFTRSDVSASISGQAAVTRRDRRTLINGELQIDRARVNLEQLPGSGYKTLEVTFPDATPTASDTETRPEAVILDLGLSADRRVFVSGTGIESEWGIDARITGSLSQPNIVGQADLIRGEADLLSRRFRIAEGQILFLGDLDETEVSVRADRTSGDVTSSILVSGRVSEPEITLSSDPVVPEDEILARVLFGQSPSTLSPLQAAQLAGAAAQLAGGNAYNLTGQLAAATGLDRLDFGLDESGGATLSTGKYLAEDVYLEIESGGSGAPAVILEWTPLERVAIDAEHDPEVGPKVSVQWTLDFDQLPGIDDSE